MSTAREYDDNSIDQLEGAIRVRKNPQNFLGSRGLDGAKHTVYEIVGNATDEKLAGFGDGLIVTVYEDGAISIRDFGRGVPLGWNAKKQKWNYFLVYEELFAGGKYEDNQEILKDINNRNAWSTFNYMDYPYLISIGMNGVGGACTQYTSEYFEVISYRDGHAKRMCYEKGVHIFDELEEFDTDEPTGTFIKWKPDAEVFDDANIPAKWVEDLCKDLSFTARFNVTFVNEKKGTKVEYVSKTIQEEMRDRAGVCATNSNMYHCVDDRGDVCVCQAEVVMGSGSGKPQFYNNMIEIRGGSHSNGLNGALYDFFTEIGKQQGIKIKDSDYAGRLSFIVTTLANKMSLRGQTKDSLDDEYIRICIYNCILQMLKTEYAKGTKWLVDVINDVVYASQLRIAQEELLKNHKDIEKSIKRHKLSAKFISCPAYEEGKSEVVDFFIVEGDSAGGRVETARNSYFQCLLPIRGKSLNVYKASIEKLLANREIQDIISVLGCGIDLGIEGYETFDIKKLRVGNVYILADADIDGKHIAMLLFLIFYKLFPQLLYEGKVWIVDSPLYVINTTSDEAIYCMNETELAEKRAEIGENRIRSIDRFKGLGETNADALWDTTLNPETRHVRQLKIKPNDTEITDVLEVLFGKSTERRKRSILGGMISNFDDILEGMDSLEDYIEGCNLNGNLEIEEVVV